MAYHSQGRPAPPLWTALFRGAIGRCPRCGQSPLFARYLKQVKACAVCGTEFGHMRADDAAPWLTIVLVGHIFLPVALSFDLSVLMPFWLQMLVWGLAFGLLSIAILPRAKGFFIAILWLTRAPGSETGRQGG